MTAKSHKVHMIPTGRLSCSDPKVTCETCGRWTLLAELNQEAVIHHGARKLECLDRKTCERKKRRAGL